jgi:hypothetical protein
MPGTGTTTAVKSPVYLLRVRVVRDGLGRHPGSNRFYGSQWPRCSSPRFPVRLTTGLTAKACIGLPSSGRPQPMITKRIVRAVFRLGALHCTGASDHKMPSAPNALLQCSSRRMKMKIAASMA